MPTGMVGVELPDEQASVPGATELEFAPPDPWHDWHLARVPPEETAPGVIRLLGRVIVTLSPTATLICCEASNATWTWRVVEVACITVWLAWAALPTWADSVITRMAECQLPAWPRASVPFWVSPRARWSFSSAVVVSEPQTADCGLS